MTWRVYRVTRKLRETPNTISIYLSAADDRPLQPFSGGQHLRFEIPAVGERAYILSAFSPKPRSYRISVKHRAGEDGGAQSGAAYWRDRAEPGDLIRASGPAGSFHLPQQLERPLVLITAGAGEASLAAIAEELAVRAARHPVWFLHQTVNASTFAFKDKLSALRADLPNAGWRIWYRNPRQADRKVRDYDHRGEMELLEIAHLLPSDCGYYVCGPDDFVPRIVEGLQRLGVGAARVHAECVGPEEEQSTELEEAEPRILSLAPKRVSFVRSGVSAIWNPHDGSLLEFAERLGISPAFSCRTGMCGTCAQPVVSGNAAQTGETIAKPHPGHLLLCSSAPLTDMEIDL